MTTKVPLLLLDAATQALINSVSGKQPLDTDLTAIAALVSAADKILASTGVGTWGLIDAPAVARTLLAATTQALQRTALGLSAAATATASVGGTFTPVLRFGAASVGITYSTQTGQWVRMGPILVWHARIILTSKGSSVGAADITGLPVAAANENQLGDIVSYANMASITSPYGFIANAATSIALVQYGAAAQANMTDANFTNTSVLVLGGVLDVGAL